MKTIINSRKFDGTIHRSWHCDLVERANSLLTFIGEFSDEVNHPELGLIRRGTISYEYYWLDKMYNVFRFHEPEGELRNFYCNLNLPPVFNEGVLDYVDLEIDVLVKKNFEFEILDLEEFEENSQKYNYSQELKLEIANSLEELLDLIACRRFPFDN